MSFVALAMVLGHFAIYGIAQETDEGTPAHLFSVLMILQGPIIALFAVRWLMARTAPDPANPRVSRRRRSGSNRRRSLPHLETGLATR